MKQPEIKASAFLALIYFSTYIKHGNSAFGDYLKKTFNYNHTYPINTPNTTQNVVHRSDSTPNQESKFTPRRENFNVQEVRVYGTNPTPMYLDREKKMMESLLSGKTLNPGEDLDFRKLIYGAELGKEFDALLEQTSPSWDHLEALLRKADRITRLPQSMYYDEEEGAKLSETQFRKNQSRIRNAEKRNLNVENIFKRKLQKFNENDMVPNSFDDMSMNLGGGQQIYPFGPDLSFSGAIFRQKREINPRNYFSTLLTTRKVVSNQLWRGAQGQYFRCPPPNINFQYPQWNTFATNLNNYHPVKNNGVNNFRNPSYQNLINNNFARVRQTPKITKFTPYGTMDSTLKDLVKLLNPIQQKIIRDLFLYGPPTNTTFGITSGTVPTSTLTRGKYTITKQYNNSFFARSSPLRKFVFSTRNLFVRELPVTLKPFQTTFKINSFYGQSQVQKKSTLRTPRPSTLDRKNVREWLKSLNPQDQKEIENMFFNDQSTPDIESMKNRMKDEYLRAARNMNGQFGTSNLKSTFISRNNNRRTPEDLGYYNYEDLSRLLREAPQDKLKIVNDWCDEIEQDLHRRFPTAFPKEGETRGPRPLYRATRYYPWELFSMLPPQQN